MKRLLSVFAFILPLALSNLALTEESIQVVGATLGTTKNSIIEQYKQMGVEPIPNDKIKGGTDLDVNELIEGVKGETVLSDSLSKAIDEYFREIFGELTTLHYPKSLADLSSVEVVRYVFFDNQLATIIIFFDVSEPWSIYDVRGLYLDLLERKYGEPTKEKNDLPRFTYIWEQKLYKVSLMGLNWEKWHRENDIPYTGEEGEIGNTLELTYYYKPVNDLIEKAFEEMEKKFEDAIEGEAEKL